MGSGVDVCGPFVCYDHAWPSRPPLPRGVVHEHGNMVDPSLYQFELSFLVSGSKKAINATSTSSVFKGIF
jgi:hypothetical protein